ncbi:flagellar basal body rod protein FlgB [Desulfoscipio gibsoniae]|uniref:Flagellar basal body rod protein FlgB n=1 Tax=Desulfoscipio gibsoniae DSM 7213 TaxID=767817 RepID=R4KJ58_9FIRM|nr:flagellar basal body rod protein FlgB [Desulfoscipio gibsoniae]AGL01662.1 flagellar basal-body rod protein FlgB [Desulfoscipio gibsoniae DSM 7213]
MSILNDTLSIILTKQLDTCTLRQRVIANNIANFNTPGFKKSEVSFQQQLKKALDDSHVKQNNNLAELTPKIVQVKNTAMKADGNNVDIDQEMVNLATNTLLYRLATRVKSDKGNILSYVIKGGS